MMPARTLRFPEPLPAAGGTWHCPECIAPCSRLRADATSRHLSARRARGALAAASPYVSAAGTLPSSWRWDCSTARTDVIAHW